MGARSGEAEATTGAGIGAGIGAGAGAGTGAGTDAGTGAATDAGTGAGTGAATGMLVGCSPESSSVTPLPWESCTCEMSRFKSASHLSWESSAAKAKPTRLL
jgi:hypothetical protein